MKSYNYNLWRYFDIHILPSGWKLFNSLDCILAFKIRLISRPTFTSNGGILTCSVSTAEFTLDIISLLVLHATAVSIEAGHLHALIIFLAFWLDKKFSINQLNSFATHHLLENESWRIGMWEWETEMREEGKCLIKRETVWPVDRPYTYTLYT